MYIVRCTIFTVTAMLCRVWSVGPVFAESLFGKWSKELNTLIGQLVWYSNRTVNKDFSQNYLGIACLPWY